MNNRQPAQHHDSAAFDAGHAGWDGAELGSPYAQTTAGRIAGWRPPRAVIAAVPVLLVNFCAFFGQLAFLRDHLAWILPGQILVAVALESIAVYIAYHAHVARLADDAALRLQLSAYAFALVIGAMNYSHYAEHWHPTVAAVTFGLMSAISPWLWAIHSRRESRNALKARGLIEGRAVRLGVTRWTWHPIRSARVMWHATWEGITSPAEAIAAARAAELPAVEMDPAILAAMTPKDRIMWAFGAVGGLDVPKACALLTSLGAPVDPSNAREHRRKLADLAKKTTPELEGSQA